MPEEQPTISREIEQIMFEDLGGLSPIIPQASSARTTGTQAAGTHTGLTVTLDGKIYNIPIVAVALVAAVLLITHKAVK
ncbi:MAG: hypothetical protein KAJ19_11195 [Gammaproteobacteria bacterium]|nr:hypothetical protein [Gammaproteobacteria bacterium]